MAVWRADDTTGAAGRSWVRITVLVAVALIAAAVGFASVVALRPDEGRSDVALRLEPADDAGADAFTPTLTDVPIDQVQVMLSTRAPSEPDPSATSDGAVLLRSGAEPGLYGGSGEATVCDTASLVDFLGSEEAKRDAWAGALGIAPGEIASYVATLTPVILTADTWVTNHGFSEGRATPRQSVLQAGTAVMVDRFGVPRVRCECGNPLAEPEVIESSVELRYEGDTWPEFDDGAVVAVEAAPEEQAVLSVTALDGSGQLDLGTGAQTINEGELFSATVTGLCGATSPVSLVDGVDPSYGDDPLAGFAGIRDVFLDLDATAGADTAIGDLDGRPGDEAAIIAVCNGGGNWVGFQIFVFTATPTGLQQVAEVPWTEGTGTATGNGVSHLAIADGWLSYQATALDEDDPSCCGSVMISRSYRLVDGALEQAPPAELSITPHGLEPALAGMTYGEAALALGREIDVSTLFDEVDIYGATCTDVAMSGLDDAWGIGSEGRVWSYSIMEPGITTPEGIGIGSTGDDLLAAYPNARAEPNEYLPWPDYYVDVTGDDGTALALRFIIDEQQRVAAIMGGRHDEVSLVEGCV